MNRFFRPSEIDQEGFSYDAPLLKCIDCLKTDTAGTLTMIERLFISAAPIPSSQDHHSHHHPLTHHYHYQFLASQDAIEVISVTE